MIGRGYSFELTDAEYDKYAAWCKEHKLDGYHGAIGGSTSFEITPTSLGDIIVAYAEVLIRDELGEVSYDSNGCPKKRRIECVLRELM